MTRAAKPLVILIFSLLWLIVSIMRVPESIGKSADIGIDISWVIALPETLYQGSISGRDFHFTYGPLSQVLAYAGASLHTPWSAIDSLPLVMLAFYTASIVLFASILLLLDSLGWKKCILLYAATAGLNLFSEPTAFRPLALMVCAVLFYRALRTDSLQAKVAWSAAAGATCFAAQLLTFELGPYGVAMAALVTGVLLIRKDRRARPLGCLSVFVTVWVVANVNLDLLFFLSSRQYHFFDYLRYAFEMIQGFTFSQGLPWELAAAPTLGLALAGIFAIGAAVFLFLKSDSKDAGLFLPLLVCSLIELKSVTVRSDLGHITQAGSPLVFILVLSGAIFLSQWRTSKTVSIFWAAAFATLWFSWPWAGKDFGSKLIRAGTTTSPIAKLSLLRAAENKPSDVLPEGLVAETGFSAPPLLAFPYQNYIPAALRRRIVAPVLMSYNASTEPLQELYVANLERERNLEVVYGMDNVGSITIDEVQAITRVPLVFDYLYKHFRLGNDTSAGKGFYLLQRDAISPRGFDAVEMVTKIGQTGSGATEIRPQTPAACNLLRLNLEVDYPITRYLGRPTPLELLFSKDGTPFLKTVLVAIKSRGPFSTYVSLIPADRFNDIFGTNPIAPMAWDKLQIAPRSSDWLGVSPSKIDIQKLECLVVRAGG